MAESQKLHRIMIEINYEISEKVEEPNRMKYNLRTKSKFTLQFKDQIKVLTFDQTYFYSTWFDLDFGSYIQSYAMWII